MQKIKNNLKLYGRERICASMIDTKIKGKTLNIGAGEMQWIENNLFLNNNEFISSDLDKKNLGKENKSLNKLQCDATKLPFKNESLTQVIMLDVLEHIKNDKGAVDEIYRVLKRKGHLIICVPNDTLLSYLNPVRYVQHERHYSINSITKILTNKGFILKKIFAGGSIIELIALYIHFFAKYLLRKKVNVLAKYIDTLEYLRHNSKGNEIAILAIKS
ncbi:class I SAM-dependent methyltransferase [Candidatus Pacearchaeota archaeon]|nr:class I SAM-dependent methyltransferase [Candidatus Pacearchaeota archaeon]